MAEQRRFERRLASSHAEIKLSSTYSLSCMLMNVSPHGAKIVLYENCQLPWKFHLRAAGLNLDVEAKTIWREGKELGVSFPLSAHDID